MSDHARRPPHPALPRAASPAPRRGRPPRHPVRTLLRLGFRVRVHPGDGPHGPRARSLERPPRAHGPGDPLVVVGAVHLAREPCARRPRPHEIRYGNRRRRSLRARVGGARRVRTRAGPESRGVRARRLLSRRTPDPRHAVRPRSGGRPIRPPDHDPHLRHLSAPDVRTPVRGCVDRRRPADLAVARRLVRRPDARPRVVVGWQGVADRVGTASSSCWRSASRWCRSASGSARWR